MQSGHINFNITKTILHTPPMHEVYGNVTSCRVFCLPTIRRINAALITVTLPPPTLHLLGSIFHNMVSAVIAVLVSSRPRALRLTRSVSSWAFFVVTIAPKIRAIRVIRNSDNF